MRLISKKNLLFSWVACLGFGCAHSEKSDPRAVEKDQLAKVSENLDKPSDAIESNAGEKLTFETGEWVHYEVPSPSYQPIFAIWSSPEGEVLQKSHAYHGWDINLDGALDMFESLDLDGVVHARLYDYNFDGVIDETVELGNTVAAKDISSSSDQEDLTLGGYSGDGDPTMEQKTDEKLETLEVQDTGH